MDSYIERQLSLLDQALLDYELGKLGLNSLIHRIEALKAAIGVESLRDALWPIVSSMEEINAVSLSEGRTISGNEADII
jgi:hypothetical protein